jgi:hypothetical protein
MVSDQLLWECHCALYQFLGDGSVERALNGWPTTVAIQRTIPSDPALPTINDAINALESSGAVVTAYSRLPGTTGNRLTAVPATYRKSHNYGWIVHRGERRRYHRRPDCGYLSQTDRDPKRIRTDQRDNPPCHHGDCWGTQARLDEHDNTCPYCGEVVGLLPYHLPCDGMPTQEVVDDV